MTNEQVEHLNGLLTKSNTRTRRKYEKGVDEHGGNLWDNSPIWLLEQAIDEAIDQVVYLLTLQERLVDYKPMDVK